MAVEKFSDDISRIRDLLSENPEGLTIKNISEMLGMNRNSAAKSLQLLQMQGRATLKSIGAAKLYCPASKLPADAVLKLSNNGVIVLSKGETIVEANEHILELLQVNKTDLLGKTVDKLPFFVESHPELPRLIREGMKGKENRISTVLLLKDRSNLCMLTSCPVFFESGDPGVALIVEIPASTSPILSDHDTSIPLNEIDEIEYICRFSPDGTLTHVNKAYCDHLQKGKPDIIGQKWRPAVPEREYEEIKKCLLSLDPNHPVALQEFKVITPQGDFRWQRWIYRNLFDQDGQSTGYMGTGIDITEIKNLEDLVRKGAEERENLVREQEAVIQDLNRQIYHEISHHEKTNFQLQFTQFVVDNASHLVTWVNNDGKLVYLNKEARHVLGYPDHEWQGRKFLDIIAGGSAFPWDDIWMSVRHHQRYTLETTLMTRKGGEIPVEMVLNYLEFKGKQYCCCFAKEITERKQVEEAMRRISAYNRILIEASLDPLVTIDFWGKISDVNTSTEKVTGYTRAELIGTSFSDYFTEPEQAKKGYQQVFRDGSVRDYPLSFRHRDGHITPVLYNATVYRDESGNINGVFAAARDISELKSAEEALQQTETIFHTMFESHNSVMLLVEPETGKIVQANPAAGRFYGRSLKGLCDMSINEINTQPPDEVVMDLEKAAIGEPKAFIFRHRVFSGEIKTVEVYTSPITIGGKTLHFSIVHEITRRAVSKDAAGTQATEEI
jgi:PAS domain S-box-containing protein